MTTPGSEGTSGPSIRVLIADDQKVFREGLAMMLGLLPGIEVTGTAIDGADAVRQVASTDPDIVLMDLSMPTLDGVEATRQLVERGTQARVVVLTTYADDDWVFRGPTGRGPRVPHQGRRGGGDPARHRHGRLWGGPAGPVHAAATAGGVGHRGAPRRGALGVAPSGRAAPDDGLTAREAEVLVEIAQGAPTARSQVGCSCPRPPSRPT